MNLTSQMFALPGS